MVRGVGFEPTNSERADLQSAVFDRFTNPAHLIVNGKTIGADRGIRTHDPLFTKQPL
jgi:hypothetical protein